MAYFLLDLVNADSDQAKEGWTGVTSILFIVLSIACFIGDMIIHSLKAPIFPSVISNIHTEKKSKKTVGKRICDIWNLIISPKMRLLLFMYLNDGYANITLCSQITRQIKDTKYVGIFMCIFSICDVLFSNICGRLSDKYGHKLILSLSMISQVIGLLLGYIGNYFDILPLMYLCSVFFALQDGALQTECLNVTGEFFKSQRDEANCIFRMFQCLGGGLCFIISPLFVVNGEKSASNTMNLISRNSRKVPQMLHIYLFEMLRLSSSILRTSSLVSKEVLRCSNISNNRSFSSIQIFGDFANKKYRCELQDMYKKVNKRGKDRDPIPILEGDRFNHFKCTKIIETPELKIKTYYFKHETTGADYIHIDTSDTDNVFGICVKTPSVNNTGVCHIMEHSVLCGSKHFPVHDPFFKMRNRSLNTYFDAVYHPLLREEDFKQEAWRYESQTHSIQGVVYNEMKGYFNQSSMHIYEGLKSLLLQNTPYANIAGGHPLYIPELTYEQFLDFHKHNYQPSNSLFYTYGDFSPLLHTRFLSKSLHRYKLADHNTISLPNYNKNMNNNNTYKDKYSMSIPCPYNNMEGLPPSTVYNHNVICNELAPSPSSINGYDSIFGRSFLSYGVMGIDNSEEKKHQLDITYRNCLQQIRDKGFEQDRILGLLNQLEMTYLDQDVGTGLRLFSSISKYYSEEQDLYTMFSTKENIDKLKKNGLNKTMKESAAYYLSQEPHKLTIYEDPNYLKQYEEEEKRNIEKYSGLYTSPSPSAIPDDDSKLPTLTIQDIPIKSPEEYPNVQHPTSSIYTLSIPTEKLIYLTLLVDLSSLSYKHLQSLNIFSSLLPKVGNKKRSMNDLELYLTLKTGGVSASSTISTQRCTTNIYNNKLLISAKMLSENIPDYLSVLKDMLCTPNFTSNDSETLLNNYIQEEKQKVENSCGNYAYYEAMKNRDISCFVSNIINGYPNYIYNTTTPNEELISSLSSIPQTIFKSNQMQFYIRGDQHYIDDNIPLLNTFISEFPKNMNSFIPIGLGDKIGKEGDMYIDNSSPSSILYKQCQDGYIKNTFRNRKLNVNETTSVFDGPQFKDNDFASTCLMSRIREEGGAYGCSMQTHKNGHIIINTHSNPHIIQTKDTILNMYTDLKFMGFTQKDLDEAKLSYFSDLDSPEYRANLLKTTLNDIYTVRDKYLQIDESKIQMAVFGGDEGEKEVKNHSEFTIV
ncbi:hypothetical protein WA158_005649 [Blastocystis sp. Blastoise]